MIVYSKDLAIEIKKNIQLNGFHIVNNLIPNDIFNEARLYWINFFSNIQNNKLPNIKWNVYLGEKNKITFSNNKKEYLYRVYDFYWNKSFHQPSKDLLLEISNYIKNEVKNSEKNLNIINEDCYGVYASASYYPANYGFLTQHSDQLNNSMLIHHIIPLTFKNKDFSNGGLFIINKNGKKILIEDLIVPGDIIFYDGNLKHGVDKIDSSKKDIGRIQLFGIPTNFQKPYYSESLIEDMDFKFNFITTIKKILRLIKNNFK